MHGESHEFSIYQTMDLAIETVRIFCRFSFRLFTFAEKLVTFIKQNRVGISRQIGPD
jgi:hypothetical protein